MSTLDDLIQPVAVAEWKASIYEVISITGVSTTSWKPGAVVRTIVAALAICLGALSSLVSLIARAGYLEFARGTWLTLLAKHFYGIDRLLATFGTCTIRLTNSGGGVYDFDPQGLILLNPDTNKIYRNVNAVSLHGPGFIDFEAIAVEAGALSTSTEGTIVRLETPRDGLSCTNTTSCVGQDDELDTNLIARCRETLGARSPLGPREAYDKAAREALRVDGTPTSVIRTRTVKDGFGNVYLYCATASGGVFGDSENIATDLGAINDACQRKAVPLGVTLHTVSAATQPIAFAYTVYLKDTAGVTAAQANALLLAALGAYASQTPIGGVTIDEGPGFFFLDAARVAMSQAIPDNILHVAFTSPASDVQINAGAVSTIGTAAGTIVFKDQRIS